MQEFHAVVPMDFTLQEVALIVLVGVIAGLLPSTIAERRGIRLAADIGAGVTAVFLAAWLATALRELVPISLTTPAGKPQEGISVDINIPNYEPVVLPLAPLKPLLKPVVFRSREEICDTLVQAALNNDLPVPFFIRLIYQESTFRPAAISNAGALGIAQFMPETAAHRRLDNPFDPVQAIPASARLLRDHYRRYGNLGLAAAAYNGGPRRVDEWRAKKGPMPQETQDYVRIITGFPVETWTAPLAGTPAVKLQQGAPCQESAGLLAWDGPDQIPMPVASPRVVEAKAAAVAAAAAAAAAREAAKKEALAKKNAKTAGAKKHDAQQTKLDAKEEAAKKETKQDGAQANQDKKGAETPKHDAREQNKKGRTTNGKGAKDGSAAASDVAGQ
jgi:hypothetical protein